MSCASEPKSSTKTSATRKNLKQVDTSKLVVVFTNNPNFKEDFKVFLDKQPEQSLPFIMGEDAFQGYGGSGGAQWKEFEHLPLIDSAMFREISDTVFRRIVYNLYGRTQFFKKLPAVNDKVGVMIVESGQALFLVSYDLEDLHFIDAEELALFGDNYFDFDSYFGGGFCINKDYVIYRVSTCGYESPPGVNKYRTIIDKNGSFITDFYLHYESCFDETIDDYEFPYYRTDFKPVIPLTAEVRKQKFDVFLSSIAFFKLPVNSNSFTKYYQVADSSISKQTELYHHKLKKTKDANWFISNNPYFEAFNWDKAQGKEWQVARGDWYYPIFHSKYGKYDLVGFIFNSSFQTNDAIYIKLNTYDTGGNIIDSKVLTRNYYGYDFTNHESFVINTDGTIKIKTWKQQFESAYEGVGKESDTRKDTTLMITADGNIK